MNRLRYHIQQQNLVTITKHLSSLKLEQLAATSSTLSDTTSISNDLRDEIPRICPTIQNSGPSAGLELVSTLAVEEQSSSLSRNCTTDSWLRAGQEYDRSALSSRDQVAEKSREQTLTKDTLNTQSFITRTLLGAITVTTKTRRSRLNSARSKAQDHERYHYEHESSLWILPAQWLLRLGFKCAYSFSTHGSSTRGWQFSVKPINLVPNDAPIFEFSRQGNTEKVRDLILRNLASVRDVDSKGRTALHVSHPALNLIGEVTSQSSIKLTPVLSLPRKIVARSCADF